MRSFAEDLVSRGVSSALASSFVSAVAATTPELVSEHGQGGGFTSPNQPAGYTRPPGYHFDAKSGFYINAQGAVDPNDPDVQAALAKSAAANPGAAGGGGGGGGGTTSTVPQLDWSAYLANWGFEAGDIAELDKIFKTYSDPNQASAAGLAYIRGTQWYARTFAGIGAGIKAGLFSDEAGYRSYVNDLNQVYSRFYNRNVTTNEVQDFLNQGTNPNAVNSHLTGQAALQGQLPDIQYALGAFDSQGRATDAETSAYGDTLGGLSNMLGPQLQGRIDKARQKMSTIFQGVSATPSLSMVMGRPAASSFGTDISKPDVSA